MSEKVFQTGIVYAAVLGLLSLSLADKADPPSPLFPTVAEALSAPNEARGIKVGYRMFSTPDLPAICARSPRPAALVGPRVPVILRVAEWFSLDRLLIFAVDASGRPLSPVPIALEVEEKQPPLLDLRAYMIAVARLLPVRAGSFRFRARTICPDTSAEVLINAMVSES